MCSIRKLKQHESLFQRCSVEDTSVLCFFVLLLLRFAVMFISNTTTYRECEKLVVESFRSSFRFFVDGVCRLDASDGQYGAAGRFRI